MKKALLLFTTLISISVFSQKRELGNVTIEELKEKVCPKDTSAVAAVLFEKGKTYFEYKEDGTFKVITEVDVKIKVYKKEGYNYANEAVSYYVGDVVDQTVSFEKAVTYNLVNGAIEKTKLKSEGEFVENINKYWANKKITMPNVKEGSIIEYRYVIKSPYVSGLRDWTFQRKIPVLYSEYKSSIPEFYTYNIYRKGTLTINEVKTQENRKATFRSKELVGGGYDKYTEEMMYYDNVMTFKMENVPVLKDESYVNNINNYASSVQYELASIQMRSGRFESFATDWEATTKKIYEYDDFGPQLKKESYFENDLKALLSGMVSRDEKIATIFNYVKSRMTWDGMHSYTCDKGVSKAYQDKSGNSAEINLMLTAMLRHAGIDANPVLLSTRSNGISLFPSRNAFNYVIAAVEIDNNLTLLDATDKFALPNILPIRDLNWFGRVIRKDGTSDQVDLSTKIISKDYTNLMASISATGEVSGKIKEQYSDYNGFVFRDQNNKLANEVYLEKLEKRLNNIEVDGHIVENKTELDKPVIETYSFKHNNSVQIIGDKMYFEPLLFFAQTQNPFKQETREYPIDFDYPNQDKYSMIINIPEGYVVESLPAPITVVFSDDLLTFKYNISSNGKQIQVASVFDSNTSILSADYYEELKAFYAAMIKKQTEKVVLKKG